MVLIIPADFQLLSESKSPVGHWSCNAGRQWAHTCPQAWPLVGCWAGSCIPRALPTHTKDLSRKTDLGHILKSNPWAVLCRTRPLLNRQIPHKDKLLGNLSGDWTGTWSDQRQFQLADQLKFTSQENRTPHYCLDLQLPSTWGIYTWVKCQWIRLPSPPPLISYVQVILSR